MADVIRVGHKGADGIVAGNTLGSFEAARVAGVDMIEFDVLSERLDGSGRLLVAHDYAHVREAPELAAALEHLSGPAFDGLEFDVDLKLPGYELRTIDALARAGLLERSLISSMYRQSLAVIRRADPAIRLGWSVPRVRRDYTTGRLTRAPALALAGAYRLALPRMAARALADGACDAVMAQWRLVGPELVRAVAQADGELFVWTVDDAAQMARLLRLGVSGVITNDPRLFQAISHPAAL